MNRTATFTLAALALLGCSNEPSSSDAETTSASPAAEITRGEYLVRTSACHDCHTPLKMGAKGPEPDMARMLSGHPADFELPPPPEPVGPWMVSVVHTNTAWSGPWGVSFTANLTPDDATGIGRWTRQTFIDTVRNGRHVGVGRPLLPPMPSGVYGQMTDADLGAIFAYLKTIPAISNRVPPPIPPGRTAQGSGDEQ